MVNALRMEPRSRPGASVPGRMWNVTVDGEGHASPCGLIPGGAIVSGLIGSMPAGGRLSGEIGSYVPPAPACNAPLSTAASPELDGAGFGCWLSPRVAPSAAAGWQQSNRVVPIEASV